MHPKITKGLDEQELIRLLRQGDEAAFRHLVETYHERVMRLVLGILRDPVEAEDAAQETFIRVHESIGGFREDARLSTWIHRIALNRALEKVRRNRLRERLGAWLPGWVPQDRAGVRSGWMDPGIRAEDREKAAALYRAIDSLPRNQRIAFTLVVVQRMRYDEVCPMLGLGVKAVESLVSRAKAGLRKKLEAYRNPI